jgi:serine protease AprX
VLTAGQSRAYKVAATPQKPFKATLVYTDPAGSPTVEVVASQINADGHVETVATDADYALVAQ